MYKMSQLEPYTDPDDAVHTFTFHLLRIIIRVTESIKKKSSSRLKIRDVRWATLSNNYAETQPFKL